MEENKNSALDLLVVLILTAVVALTAITSQGLYYDNAKARRTACWNFYQTQALAHPESRTSGQCAG